MPCLGGISGQIIRFFNVALLPGRNFIFEGREILHFVTMAEGEVSRVSLQFAYDLQRMEFTKEKTARYYGYKNILTEIYYG